MHVVICEDDLLYRNSLVDKVKKWMMKNHREDSVSIQQFASSEDLLEAWEHGLNIDMLFLDIEIPKEMDGLTLAKTIFSKCEHIPIAFVTNYSEYACDGYLVNAMRYIVKPIQCQAVFECMDIAWKRWKLADTAGLYVDTGKMVLNLPLREIIYLECIGHRVFIHVIGGSVFEVSRRLKEYKQKVPEQMFVQCHKSYVVNLMYVRKIYHNFAFLTDDKQIPIGRKYATLLYGSFCRFYQGENSERRT